MCIGCIVLEASSEEDEKTSSDSSVSVSACSIII